MFVEVACLDLFELFYPRLSFLHEEGRNKNDRVVFYKRVLICLIE